MVMERVWSLTILDENSGHFDCVTMNKFPNYSGQQVLNL